MARKSLRKPADFPQTEDTWLLAVRKLRLWITPDDKPPERPFLTMILNHTQELILASSVGEIPDPAEAQKILFSAMTKPQKLLGARPGRPAKIVFEDVDFQQALAPALQEIGIQALYRPTFRELDELVRELEAHMRGDQPEIHGLLSSKGASVKVVAALFEAAAEYHRAAPWIYLGNEDLLAVRVEPQKEPHFVSVMGQGGMEYGLALYKSWTDVERMFGVHDHPMERIPDEGLHSLLFNEIVEVPFDDLDDIEKYGWNFVGPDAYPVPMIYMPSGEVRRPDAEEILWYEAVLRAVPGFVRDHARKNPDGELQPVEAKVIVAASSGSKSVEFRFPAGDLNRGAMPAFDLLDEWDESDEPEVPFDRRIMEGSMAQLLGEVGQSGLDPEVKKAQVLMYRAWDEQNPAKRLALAHQALAVSTNCADAYVLLAEEEATSLEQALKYYQKGVSAGERALGKRFFKENAGHFWGLLETRPYMRALEGKARCLWELRRREEALDVYQDMLRLNPNDNQGMRYLLLDLLLTMNREAELVKLISKYKDEWSTVWLYTHALLEFRKSGPSAIADRKLRNALEQNPHVVSYLTGKKRVPRRYAQLVEWGGESEAVQYASGHLNYWRATPGAVEWLTGHKPKSRSPAKRTAGKGRKKQATRK